MSVERDQQLDEIAEALSALNPSETPTVLVGWVAVAEYMDMDGNRWLAVRSGSAADSEHATTSWQRRGYMYEVLEANWLDDPDTDFMDVDE